jgi:hypothetical protein
LEPQERISILARVAISILQQLIFVAAMVWAFVAGDENIKLLFAGAAISNATTAVQWWLGSSRSSEQKDATIKALSGTPAPANTNVATAAA